MLFILILLLFIYILINIDHNNSIKTYNREYSNLYDIIWNDEDRYKAEVKYISLTVGDKKLDSILDIGCGTGNHIKFWKETWASSIITGMDISFSQLAKLHEKHPDINTVHGNFLDGRTWTSNTFDMIACMYGAGQYTGKVKTLLKNVYKWLKPGGIFRLVVPDLFWRTQEYFNHARESEAADIFQKRLLLRATKAPKGLESRLRSVFGLSMH